MIITYEKLYKEVLGFCRKNKYLKDLQRSLAISEEARFNDKEILKRGLDVLDAVHCVVDKNRTIFFLQEIKRYVNKNSNVLEAGIGTGILSLYAASIGGKVVGLEINKKILSLAEQVKRDLLEKSIVQKNNPSFKKQNALDFNSKDKFDLIISENIYTGMFYEKQIDITNHLRKYLNHDGKMIPSSMQNWIKVCNIKNLKDDKEKTLIVPDLKKNKIEYVSLSRFFLYDELDFSKKLQKRCSYQFQIKPTKNTNANALLIKSDIFMPSGRKIAGTNTIFFNNDIFLTIKPVPLRKNQLYWVNFSYKYGSKPKDLSIKITPVN